MTNKKEIVDEAIIRRMKYIFQAIFSRNGRWPILDIQPYINEIAITIQGDVLWFCDEGFEFPGMVIRKVPQMPVAGDVLMITVPIKDISEFMAVLSIKSDEINSRETKDLKNDKIKYN